jgi:hypothetical protein
VSRFLGEVIGRSCWAELAVTEASEKKCVLRYTQIYCVLLQRCVFIPNDSVGLRIV